MFRKRTLDKIKEIYGVDSDKEAQRLAERDDSYHRQKSASQRSSNAKKSRSDSSRTSR